MKIKINARLKPRPLFEIRYIKSGHRGSFPIIGLATNRYGFYLCLGVFMLALTMARRLEPSPLTEEEKEILKQEQL